MNANIPSGPLANGVAAPPTLHERACEVRTREEFIQFVRVLASNRDDKPDEWENPDLPAYLEALAAWVEDMDGYFQGRREPVPQQPTWNTLAQIVLAAKVYE